MIAPAKGNGPPRLVLSGCGAVSRLFAAPALSALGAKGTLSIAAVFDPDPAAAGAVAARLFGAKVAPSFEALLGEGGEIALIAAPPHLHAAQTIAALDAGFAVLCEKPMALALADADAMIAAAERTGRALSTGFVRRFLPATAAIRGLLANGAIGELRRIDWFEGGPFSWPVASPAWFADRAGGGVLSDIGSHVFDLLAWWLGPPRLVSYDDDAMGGVEANAAVTLTYGEAEAHIRLSRDWARPNRVTITGTAGEIGWSVGDGDALDVRLGPDAPASRLLVGEPRRESFDIFAAYEAEIAAFAASVAAGASPPVPARAGRDALALVAACQASRRLMAMPWLSPDEAAKAASLAGEAA